MSSQVRALYRSAPEGFITERDALARRLRDEGRDQEAAEVKKLRRPTVAAWALDLLADEAADAIGELIAAGRDLARAQRGALAGRDPKALRDASAARRDLVDRLSKQTANLLRDAGRAPDPHLDDIRGTLESASTDDETAERLRTGTLERAVRPEAGFGDVVGLQLVPGWDADDEEGSGSKRGRSRGPRAQQVKQGELEAEVRRLRRDRDAAERKARAADETRQRLATQVESMLSRLDAAREKLKAAASDASEERLKAKRAAKAFDMADRKLRDSRSSKR